MIDIVIILAKNIHKKNTFGYDDKKEIKKTWQINQRYQSSLALNKLSKPPAY